MVELFNEDCMETMARYPDGHFDLAVCDPPYGIGQDWMKRKSGYKKKFLFRHLIQIIPFHKNNIFKN